MLDCVLHECVGTHSIDGARLGASAAFDVSGVLLCGLREGPNREIFSFDGSLDVGITCSWARCASRGGVGVFQAESFFVFGVVHAGKSSGGGGIDLLIGSRHFLLALLFCGTTFCLK